MAEWDHTVPVRELSNPMQLSNYNVSSMYRLEANMFNDQLLNSLCVDPTAPLDFGRFDLAQITGVSTEEPSEDDDFGVVPLEPYRDGMVPSYNGYATSRNSSMIVVRKNTNPPPPTSIVVSQPTSFQYLFSSPAISVQAMKTFGNEYSTAKPTTTQQSVSVKQDRHWRAALPPPEPAQGEAREEILARWREKKARRHLGGGGHQKVRYESRRRTALSKPRINGKFVKSSHPVEVVAVKLHVVPTTFHSSSSSL